ncbi:MAG: guanylate kinase [Halanaerobiaceae bacterium]
MERGLLFVVSGPSGVGKGTVIEALMKEYDEINYSVSATTREPRAGEIDGEDYYFLSEEEFFMMEEKGEFIESACVHNNYYGTPRSQVLGCMDRGEDIILEIDIQGANQVKEEFNNCILIFLLPPSFKELEKRLKKRGTESQRCRKIRLKNAREEIEATVTFDYEIVNDNLRNTVEEVKRIIKKEKMKKRGSESHDN